MLKFNIIAFTHHNIGVEEIGKFHIEGEQIIDIMNHLKSQMNIEEMMYVSTCNRVEFVFVTQQDVDASFITHFLNEFNEDWDQNHISKLLEAHKHWNGINAVNHLIEVACSLDSMVIGEREIITQLKDSFEFARKSDISGDTIRLVMKQVIETAKRVYTQTDIATKPVSVVSLAYQQLLQKGLDINTRVLIVGAGVTNTNMGRFLIDHGYANFTVFNRSLGNAKLLAEMLKGEAKTLEDLHNYSEGFDLLVTCTASTEPVITTELYSKLLAGDKSKKIVIDLAVPADIDSDVIEQNDVDYISIEFLKSISDSNLALRKRELIKVRQIIYEAVEEFKELFKLRQIEIKMRSIPERVKEIRSTAMNEVFSKDLEQLDEHSREVLEKILNYMEKKYVSVPMIAAKEMFSEKNTA
ncbi:glutamyl-tRNA reductase [Paracrocinitomix mangrovi]|uniref:glutamyl-tRNA reductase n=1 Tax=Paracrocinitomix mangrovi TaxID=2862509 RepID=UPI001C8E3816|nr:glutamyl-tRNA reductase [Paracrocinitomix mangrovi]UKN00789.1 glutamyl-tRNA reductase [Paracrocinitomix mangrovi]